MFFSPCGAVLSAILRDEYLTSAVLTAEVKSLKIVQKEEFSRQLFLKMPTYRDLKTRRKVFEE